MPAAAASAGIGEFSAFVAHELNNIAAPLLGFIDLATENPGSADSIGQCLDEVRLGIARVTALSRDIETLAESTSQRISVAVGDCISQAQVNDGNNRREVLWGCDSKTLLDVDPFHAARAIVSLVRIGGCAAALTITGDLRDASACTGCGAALTSASRYLRIEVRPTRILSGKLLRSPFAAHPGAAASLRLTAAVLLHCTHLAGGHILADSRAKSMGLALPIA